MRDDIWYRGNYKPTAPSERRVMLSDAGAWLVDRATFDSRATLSWHAEHTDTPAAKAALNGFAQMRQLTASPSFDTGYFLPEQLCQLAATLAARRSDSHDDPANVCGELARAMIQTLVAMPFTQAMNNLVAYELIPDNEATVQAQLLLHAAYQANKPDMATKALDALHHRGTFNWIDAQDLSEQSSFTAQLNLSSPALIRALRHDLDTRQRDGDGSLHTAWCHFPANTSVSEAVAWLDQASNFPIEHRRKNGTIRVVEDWITGNSKALIQQNDTIQPMDQEARFAAVAVAAYLKAADADAKLPAFLNPLQREAVAQRAAHLSRFELTGPDQARDNGVRRAVNEVTSFYRASTELWQPLVYSSETDNASGTLLMRDLAEKVEHTLTTHGIAHLADFYRELAAWQQRDDVQYRQTPESVSFQVPMKDFDAQLQCRTSPLARLAILGSVIGKDNDVFIPLTEEDKADFLAAANLAQHDFVADDGPAFDHETPHQYGVIITTERRQGNDAPDATEQQSESDTMEADELMRLVRNKGITSTPTVAQHGDGSWHVSYRSETPDESREYFEQGIETYYTLQLEHVNGQPVNPENAQVFAQETGLSFHNPYSPKPAAQSGPRFG
ncbi:hypothetical protein [Pseudomonas sp.]|uniref:hypothetical protein n=1 Tax=Pseudomonas sp. TaxID=306 RepID=UPI002908ABB3|nr:hypothetical protein [Pseudomonas sp.]MDU4254406.1 hypothetical protein [Pseudomonas sp.]